MQSSFLTLSGGKASHLPKAVVYRTTMDYDNHVPITMNDARTEIVSYPAPSDLLSPNGYATPIALADGYLLDRRGVTKNTVFLDYTYEEYAALRSTPSRTELTNHIIDKRPIAEMYTLPITTSEAVADTTQCNAIVRNGFKGCTQIVKPLQAIRP